MVTRRIAVLTGLLLGILQLSQTLFISPTWGAPAPRADDMNFTLEGKITEKSPGKLTVSSGENMIFHVLYNEKTEIKKQDGSPATEGDLRAGVTISVAGDLAESGEITAKKIDIEAEGSTKP